MTISSDLTAQPAPAGSRTRSAAAAEIGYGRTFWFTYVANLTLMVAVSLLYRYADFVTELKGNALNLGWIVGLGMTGSLFMRFSQIGGIERFGEGRVWLWSLALMIFGLVGNLLVTTVDGPLIYLLQLRLLNGRSRSGRSFDHIRVAQSMPVPRMAEVIGTLGTSGFLAMLIGPMIGDRAVRLERSVPGKTRSHVPRRRGAGRLLVRLCGDRHARRIAAAASPQTARFVADEPLPTRADHAGWRCRGGGRGAAGGYFGDLRRRDRRHAYCRFFPDLRQYRVPARMLTRRVPHRFGVVPMIYSGMTAQVISLLAYLVVDSAWKLAIPGFFGGIAHALLFPSVVASGSGGFPSRYRGLGTIVMLATVDVGNVVGAPLVGGLLYYGGSANLDPYPTMFVVIAAGLTAITLFYAVATRGRVRQPTRERRAAVPVRL